MSGFHLNNEETMRAPMCEKPQGDDSQTLNDLLVDAVVDAWTELQRKCEHRSGFDDGPMCGHEECLSTNGWCSVHYCPLLEGN